MNLEKQLQLLEEIETASTLAGCHTLLSRQGKYYFDRKEISKAQYDVYYQFATASGTGKPFEEIKTYEDGREVVEDWLLIFHGNRAGSINIVALPDNGRD